MNIAPEELHTLGNLDLLTLPKTAFLCSRNYPGYIEHPTCLWAVEQRTNSHCVLSGFHSLLEQTVFRYLLQGEQQPIVYALGRGMRTNMGLEYEAELAADRLLFLTPFEEELTTITQETADIRNLLIAELADQFFIPYMAAGGNLERLFLSGALDGKPIFTLDLAENEPLFRAGAELYQPEGLLGGPTLYSMSA
ncbi:DNA-binding protein [Hymenobacter sp. HDW8]|uniref:DNA-binding protein n=1 Tax=Hymenobacter sp. HDW8 TaxID=2714932 RepID=UPI00140E4A0A|nr:DNA-binding protein [Hymenobacter sp. HDW8]QIL76204.1 DNA-binding protein [Hymenobacter sp. HDW8]